MAGDFEGGAGDWADIAVPPQVLRIPAVPSFDDRAPKFAEGPELFTSYVEAVAAATADWSREDRHDAVAFLLQVFNAENYFGELCQRERDLVDPALCHLLGVALPPKRDETAIGKSSVEAHKKALAAYKAMIAKRYQSLRLLLQSDGEVVNCLVNHPQVLLALRGLVERLPADDVWRMRVLYRHHQALERPSHSVFVRIADCVDALKDTDDVETLVELSFVQNAFHKEEFASASAFKALKNTGLTLEETAMFGVRTRWQTVKYVQSLVKAQPAKPAERLPAAERRRTMPRMLEGEKEGHDLFDRPRGDKDEGEIDEPALPPLDHAVVLALCHNINNNNPAYGLTRHQIQVYAERLITDKADPIYALRAMELLVRARVEYGRNRVAQRSFLQLQLFTEHFRAETAMNERPTWYRADSKYAFAVHWPPVWSLRREYAAECMDLTMFRTALKEYEDVQDWDSIIKCCSKLDRRRKAEFLAREKLEEDPENPVLWVALGEATREEAHLWKAWELSGHKMAAPMRALARLALDREQWPKVIEFFDKAVAINPVFGGDWFSLGFASLRMNDMEMAAKAFTRVCKMEPDNSYAWTNLGNVLIRLKRHRAAFSALSQALRNNRENWRMWGNYWTVATHLLEVQEATHALHTAVGLAGRDFIFEDEVLVDFTDMVLRFLRGELELTDNAPPAADEDKGEFEAAPIAGDAMNDAGVEEDGDAAPAADEGEEEACEGFEPLFVDSDDDSNGIVEAAAERRRADAAKAAKAARDAYRGRTKRVFETLISNFVDNPELYHCCARVWRELEGPEAEFKFRLKEVRETKKGMWERSETAYRRVLTALKALASVAAELATADAKRQAHDAVEHALKAADGHLDKLPVYEEMQQLRLTVSRIFVK